MECRTTQDSAEHNRHGSAGGTADRFLDESSDFHGQRIQTRCTSTLSAVLTVPCIYRFAYSLRCTAALSLMKIFTHNLNSIEVVFFFSAPFFPERITRFQIPSRFVRFLSYLALTIPLMMIVRPLIILLTFSRSCLLSTYCEFASSSRSSFFFLFYLYLWVRIAASSLWVQVQSRGNSLCKSTFSNLSSLSFDCSLIFFPCTDAVC